MKALADYLEKNPKKKIIFDLDETILELILPWEIWHKNLKDTVNKTDSELRKRYEKGEFPTHVYMNEFVKKHGKKAKTAINSLSSDFEKNHLKGTRKNNDLISFIKNNKKKFSMYVWSSNTSHVVRKVLEEAGILDCFEDIITQIEVDYIKPDPHGFSLIHDGKSDIKDYLFVGDSKSDEGAAAALGMDFFKVSF